MFLTSSFKCIEVRCILKQNGNIILTFPYTLFHLLLGESDLQPNKAVEAHQASFYGRGPRVFITEDAGQE